MWSWVWWQDEATLGAWGPQGLCSAVSWFALPCWSGLQLSLGPGQAGSHFFRSLVPLLSLLLQWVVGCGSGSSEPRVGDGAQRVLSGCPGRLRWSRDLPQTLDWLDTECGGKPGL